MPAALYDLGQELRKERTELAGLLSDASKLTAEQVDEARKREAALAEKQTRFDTLLEADQLERENERKLAAIDRVRRPVPAEGGLPDEPRPKSRSFAEIMAASEGFKNIQSGAHGGFQKGTPKTIELGELTAAESVSLFPALKSVFAPQIKTAFLSTAAPQEDERLTRIAFDEQEARSLINLPAPGTTTSASLSYLEETTFTNNAVETAEGSAAGEATLAFTERTVTIQWLPVFIPVTEIAMADIAWLESYLRTRLAFMVRQRLASQMLVGDGVSPNIKGYATFVTQTQAKGADPVFDAVFKAMVKCLNTGFAESTDAVVMHPNDWQDVRLTRTADGIYILGNPAERGSETLFGVPVYQSTHQTEGTALTGAFKEHSQLIVRDGISLAASNSHSDYFTKGQVAIRASMRCALVVYRISAFCEVTGI